MENSTEPAPAEAVLRLLGLARRAGRLNLGSSEVMRALKKADGGLVFLARDAGSDLERKIRRNQGRCRLVHGFFGRDELAAAFGRSKLAVVSVHDPAFVAGIEAHLESPY